MFTGPLVAKRLRCTSLAGGMFFFLATQLKKLTFYKLQPSMFIVLTFKHLWNVPKHGIAILVTYWNMWTHVCKWIFITSDKGLFVNNVTLQWRHNEPDGLSNHQLHDCLLVIQVQIKEKIKAPRHWPLWSVENTSNNSTSTYETFGNWLINCINMKKICN